MKNKKRLMFAVFAAVFAVVACAFVISNVGVLSAGAGEEGTDVASVTIDSGTAMKYGTLADAVNAVNNAESTGVVTLKLLSDVTITTAGVKDQAAIWFTKTGCDIVVDGNGKTITYISDEKYVYENKHNVIGFSSGVKAKVSNLTIDGCMAITSGTAYGANHGINIYEATVLLTGVRVKNVNAASVEVVSSIVTMTNCITENYGWGGANVDYGSQSISKMSSLNIAGTFTGMIYTEHLASTTGGDGATVTYSGAKVEMTFEETGKSWKYWYSTGDLAAALAALDNKTPTDDVKIKLLDNISIEKTLEITKPSLSLIVDLNGKTITSSVRGFSIVAKNVSLTINANGGGITAEEMAVRTNYTSSSDIWSLPTVTINGGTYKGSYVFLNYAKDGKFTINDAVIKGTNAGIWCGNGPTSEVSITSTTVTASDSSASVGIYLGTVKKATLTDVKVSGWTGVEVKSGDVTITGTSVRSTVIKGYSASMGDGSIGTSGSGSGVGPLVINNGYVANAGVTEVKVTINPNVKIVESDGTTDGGIYVTSGKTYPITISAQNRANEIFCIVGSSNLIFTESMTLGGATISSGAKITVETGKTLTVASGKKIAGEGTVILETKSRLDLKENAVLTGTVEGPKNNKLTANGLKAGTDGVTFTGGSLTIDGTVIPETSGTTTVGTATVIVSGESITITGTLGANASMIIDGTTKVTLGGDFTNNGTIELKDAATITASASVSSATINNAGLFVDARTSGDDAPLKTDSSGKLAVNGDSSRYGSYTNKVTYVTATIGEITAKEYTGSEIKPASVTFGTSSLTETMDYIVTYANNIDAGTATVKVTPAGSTYAFTAVTKTFTISKKSLNPDDFDVTLSSSEYNGSEITVSVNLKDGKTLGGTSDFTLAYKKDTGTVSAVKDAGEYTVTVTVPSDAVNFTVGTHADKNLTIDKKTVTVTVSDIADAEYNGSEITPVPELTWNGVVTGETMKSDTDYKVTYDNNIGAGSAKVIINTMNGSNYALTSAAEKVFTITPKNVTFEFGTVGAQIYTGSAIKPNLGLTWGGIVVPYVMTENTDYILEWASNTNVGTASVKVKPVSSGSNYTFIENTMEFTIGPKTVTLTIGNIDAVVYTGKAVKPDLDLKWDTPVSGDTMAEGVDYDVVYSSNINAGKAKVTVSPKDGSNYKFEEKYKEFSITQMIVTVTINPIASVEYTGYEIKPEPVLTVSGGVRLVKDTDYTVEWEKNTDVGTAKVTVTSKSDSNYKFSPAATAEFKIVPKTEGTLVSEDNKFKFSGETVTTGNLKIVLKEGLNEYTVTFAGGSTISSGTEVSVGYVSQSSNTRTYEIETSGYTGSFVVKLPCQAKFAKAEVFCVDDPSVSVSDIKYDSKDGYVTFTANHNSTFMISLEKAPTVIGGGTASSSDGDQDYSVVIAFVMLAVAIGFLAVMIKRN